MAETEIRTPTLVRNRKVRPSKESTSHPALVESHDNAAESGKQILAKLNALLKATKTLQSWIEDIEAVTGHLMNRLTPIETALLPTPDHGIGGGYDFPILPLKEIPKPVPAEEYSMGHDLVATSYLMARAACGKRWPDTYAAWVGSGTLGVSCYPGHCANHSEARDRAVVKADGLELDGPAEILVVGPWRGDPNRVPTGAVVAVRWSASMYEIQDPYTASDDE